MKRIAVFPHTDIAYVQYLRQVLDDQGIECTIRNENVAVAGFMERAAQAVSPELWVVEDALEVEARRLVQEIGDAGASEPGPRNADRLRRLAGPGAAPFTTQQGDPTVRIAAADLFEVEIPPIAPIRKHMPKVYDITLVRLRTDDGLEGWGEYHGVPADGRDAARQLVGEDPEKLDPFAHPDSLTCALVDIVGQIWGVPAWRFFGHQERDRVPVSYWSCPMEPAETAAEAEVGRRLGFNNHKLKARSWNIVETVRLVREAAGPDYTVGCDPNTQFQYVPQAARLARELEPFGTVSVFEDPVLKDNLDWYRLLRQKTCIPQALHTGAPGHVLAALKAECVDYLNIGGSSHTVPRAAAIAAAADVPVWVQMGGLCTGVLAAWSVHVQSTLPNATLPCDELPFTREADVLGGSLELKDGHFAVPDGGGLGVRVDLGVVERYRVG